MVTSLKAKSLIPINKRRNTAKNHTQVPNLPPIPSSSTKKTYKHTPTPHNHPILVRVGPALPPPRHTVHLTGGLVPRLVLRQHRAQGEQGALGKKERQ